MPKTIYFAIIPNALDPSQRIEGISKAVACPSHMAGEIRTFFDHQQNFHYFVSEIGIGGACDKKDLTGHGKFNPHTHSIEQESP